MEQLLSGGTEEHEALSAKVSEIKNNSSGVYQHEHEPEYLGSVVLWVGTGETLSLLSGSHRVNCCRPAGDSSSRTWRKYRHAVSETVAVRAVCRKKRRVLRRYSVCATTTCRMVNENELGLCWATTGGLTACVFSALI